MATYTRALVPCLALLGVTSCGDERRTGEDSSIGTPIDGETTDAGSNDGGTALTDGGTSGGDGGQAGTTSDGASEYGTPGYGYCSSVRVIDGDRSVEVGPVVLGKLQIDPAKGETCAASRWLDADEDDNRISLAVVFPSSEGSAHGAKAELDAAREPVLFTVAQHQIGLTNVMSGADVLFEDLSDHAFLLVDGAVSWSSPKEGIDRVDFGRVCWKVETEPDWTVECADVDDSAIELQCKPSDVDAGAVGVSSWITSPEGDTLCVLP